MTGLPKTYRVYFFDLERKAVNADFVNAVSDQEAIAMARAVGERSKCEIWEGARLVAQLDKITDL